YELRATWLAPTWPGGVVDHYEVDFDGESYRTTTRTEITVGDLLPSTQHTVTVRAVSTDGLTGPDSTVTGSTAAASPTPTPGGLDDAWDSMVSSRDWDTVINTFSQNVGHTVLDGPPIVAGTIESEYDG